MFIHLGLAYVISVASSLVSAAGTTGSARRDMVVHHRRDDTPSGFTLQGPASSNLTLNLRFALAQNSFSGLEYALYDVSTPSSPHYGQHLSKAEVCTLLCLTSL